MSKTGGHSPEYYEVKKYLKQAYDIYIQTVHFQDEIRRLKYMRDSIVKPLSDGGRGNLPGDPTGNIAVIIQEKTAKLMDELVHLENLRDDIETFILVSDLDARHKQVLLKRYIELKPWTKITQEMIYSEKHPQKLHGEALEKLATQWRKK